MHDYDPDRYESSEVGGCREAFLLTRIAYGVLLPPLAVIVSVLTLIIGSFFLLAVHPALSLLPLMPLVAGGIWMARRDRRLQEELEEEIYGPRE